GAGVDVPQPQGSDRRTRTREIDAHVVDHELPYIQGRQRSRAWKPIAYGLYVPTDADSDAALHALASQLHRGAGFTHVTAARIRQWWLPPLPAGLPEFAAQNNRNRPRRAELRIMRTTP